MIGEEFENQFHNGYNRKMEIKMERVNQSKVVIFGDSITNGYDALNHTSSPILKETTEHSAHHQHLKLSVVLQGMNGQTTREGLKRVEEVCAVQADKVLLFFGANDAAAHHKMAAVDFLTNLSNLTEKIGAEKVVLLTPPWHDDRFDKLRRSNKRLQEFRKQVLRVAQDYNLPVIDVFTAMQVDEPVKWLQSDGLHFSRLGYEKLGRLIVNNLVNWIE